MMWHFLALLAFFSGNPPVSIPIVIQQTSGWCSPVFSNVNGPVSVICIGVDPQPLIRLNADLAKEKLTASQRLEEAEQWARRYHELKLKLENSGARDQALSHEAEAYLRRGDLERAGRLLDKILKREEGDIDRTAANYYSRGLIFELEFKPTEADAVLRKAHQYRPTNPGYTLECAHVLVKLGFLKEAENVLTEYLAYRESSKSDKSENQDLDTANALNLRANLYLDTERIELAERDYKQAIRVYRSLVQKNATPDVVVFLAQALSNSGVLLDRTQRLAEAQESFLEALPLLRPLAKSNSLRYGPKLCDAITNFGNLQQKFGNVVAARNAYQEALITAATFADQAPWLFKEYRSGILLNVGNLESRNYNFPSAEAAYSESYKLLQELDNRSPGTYQRDMAVTLSNLGAVYIRSGNSKSAIDVLDQALVILRDVPESRKGQIQDQLSCTLLNLARANVTAGDPSIARPYALEAIKIETERWKADPRLGGDALAESLWIAAPLEKDLHDECDDWIQAGYKANDRDLIGRIHQMVIAYGCPANGERGLGPALVPPDRLIEGSLTQSGR